MLIIMAVRKIGINNNGGARWHPGIIRCSTAVYSIQLQPRYCTKSRTLALAVAGAVVARFQGLMAGDHIINGVVENRGLWVSYIR